MRHLVDASEVEGSVSHSDTTISFMQVAQDAQLRAIAEMVARKSGYAVPIWTEHGYLDRSGRSVRGVHDDLLRTGQNIVLFMHDAERQILLSPQDEEAILDETWSAIEAVVHLIFDELQR